MLGFDKEFIEHFNKIRGLDWKGLDLWIFGGIVSNWETKDIDTLIIGESIPEGFLSIITDLGPWDICYTNDPNSIWYPGDPPIKFKAYTVRDKWIYYNLPSKKQKLRFKYGVQYGKPIQLIKNGVFYF